MNNDIVQEFYYLALADIAQGAAIEELEAAIAYYEEVEDYEACAGILKAIEEAKYDTIQTIKKRLDDIRAYQRNSRKNDGTED